MDVAIRTAALERRLGNLEALTPPSILSWPLARCSAMVVAHRDPSRQLSVKADGCWICRSFATSPAETSREPGGSSGDVSSAALGELGPDEFECVGRLVDEAEIAGDEVTVGVLGPRCFDQAVEVERVVDAFGA